MEIDTEITLGSMMVTEYGKKTTRRKGIGIFYQVAVILNRE